MCWQNSGCHFGCGWTDVYLCTVSGVVYNEMQGALASPDAQLQKALQRAMFPDTAYGFVSGLSLIHISCHYRGCRH